MSTKEQTLVTGLGGIKGLTWVKTLWLKLVSNKKKLMLGGGLSAAVLLGFYFWGSDSSTPQYLTAKIEKGNLRNTVTATGTL